MRQLMYQHGSLQKDEIILLVAKLTGCSEQSQIAGFTVTQFIPEYWISLSIPWYGVIQKCTTCNYQSATVLITHVEYNSVHYIKGLLNIECKQCLYS